MCPVVARIIPASLLIGRLKLCKNRLPRPRCAEMDASQFLHEGIHMRFPPSSSNWARIDSSAMHACAHAPRHPIWTSNETSWIEVAQ
jgi:hypothetical protein